MKENKSKFREKVILHLLAAIFFIGSNFVSTEKTIAADVKKLNLGEEVTETFEGQTHFLSFTAKEDSYYGLDVYTIWEAINPDNPKQSFFPPFYALFYSKDGTVMLEHIPGNWYDKGVKYADNVLEKRREFRSEVYLHKGEYTILLRTNYGNPQIRTKVKAKMEKLSTKYGEDAEQNNSVANAVSPASNGLFQGYMGGYFENGDKDLEDWYVFTVPSAGVYPLTLESSAESEGKYDMHGKIMCEVYDGASKQLVKKVSSSFSSFDNLFTANDEITFSAPGTYYLAMKFVPDHIYGNNRHFSAYKVTLNGTTGAAPQNMVESLKCETTPAGVKLSWTPSGNPIGYRIFRDGVALNDKPVYGGSYVDIHAQSNKTYRYTVQLFNAGDTVQTSNNATADVKTEEITVSSGASGYILMQIGKDTMVVNEEIMEIDPGRGTKPQILNGRTLAPIRAIAEVMDGAVDWDAVTSTVSIQCGGHTVTMRIGQTDYMADGAAKKLDVAPQIINGRTMLPLRFVAESIGCQIEWIGSTQEIVIVY